MTYLDIKLQAIQDIPAIGPASGHLLPEIYERRRDVQCRCHRLWIDHDFDRPLRAFGDIWILDSNQTLLEDMALLVKIKP